MKYCSNCGAQLPDEAKFCDSCGTQQQAAARPKAAPKNVKNEDDEPPKKKTLGQKMMENYHTNMENRKKLWGKWWWWVIIAVALAYFTGACTQEEKSPLQEEMEAYVKGVIPNPDSFEFEKMEDGREYPYINALSILRSSIERKMQEPGANVDSLRKEDMKVQKAVQAFDDDDVACSEYTMRFNNQPVKNHPTRLMGIAVARYDANGKLIVITLRPDTLNRNPALQMLKQKGYL